MRLKNHFRTHLNWNSTKKIKSFIITKICIFIKLRFSLLLILLLLVVIKTSENEASPVGILLLNPIFDKIVFLLNLKNELKSRKIKLYSNIKQ